jgi:hypothetical protein
MVHGLNSHNLEVKEGRSQVQGQPGLHSEFKASVETISQKQNKNKKELKKVRHLPKMQNGM